MTEAIKPQFFVDTIAITGFAKGNWLEIYNFGESFNLILDEDSPSVNQLKDVFHKHEAVQVSLLFTKGSASDFAGHYILTDVSTKIGDTANNIEFNFVRERRTRKND